MVIVCFRLPLRLRARVIRIRVLVSNHAMSSISLCDLAFVDHPDSFTVRFPYRFMFIQQSERKAKCWDISVSVRDGHSITAKSGERDNFSLIIHGAQGQCHRVAKWDEDGQFPVRFTPKAIRQCRLFFIRGVIVRDYRLRDNSDDEYDLLRHAPNYFFLNRRVVSMVKVKIINISGKLVEEEVFPFTQPFPVGRRVVHAPPCNCLESVVGVNDERVFVREPSSMTVGDCFVRVKGTRLFRVNDHRFMGAVFHRLCLRPFPKIRCQLKNVSTAVHPDEDRRARCGRRSAWSSLRAFFPYCLAGGSDDFYSPVCPYG